MKLENLYHFLKKMILNDQSKHFFRQLPIQSSLKSTLKRFLNHSNNRSLEQKIYQKTATNNLNSYRNLSQEIYLYHNYKLFKTFTL